MIFHHINQQKGWSLSGSNRKCVTPPLRISVCVHPLSQIKHQTSTGANISSLIQIYFLPGLTLCDVCGDYLPWLSVSWEVKEEDMPQTHRLNKCLTLFFWARSERASVKDWVVKTGGTKADNRGLWRPYIKAIYEQRNVPRRFYDGHPQWFSPNA